MFTASTTPAPRTAPCQFRLETRPDGQYMLHVLGRMPLDWVTNLTSGIAHNGLSITEAQISSQGGMTWHGHFILKPSLHSTPPGQIDYNQLVRSASSRAVTGLAIDSFLLKPASGQLFLEVRGKDQIGFLGALLNKLSFFSLFPVRMEIETTAGCLLDRFWLSGTGGTEPSPAIVAVVNSTLQKMTLLAQ